MKGAQDPTVQPAPFTKISAARDPAKPAQVKVEFSVELSSLTMIYMTPGNGWKFVNSSLASSEFRWNDLSVEVSKITYGKKTDEIMTKYVELEDSPGADPLNVVTISIINIRSEIPMSQEYKDVMKKFPAYTFSMEQQSDTSIYKIKLD